MSGSVRAVFADGQPPHAANLTAYAASDCSKHITLLAWDDLTARSELNCSIVTPPANGAVSFDFPAQAPTNSYKVVYTATNGFIGTDSFVYKVNDGTQDSSAATCTVTVAANSAPIVSTKMAEARAGCENEISLTALDHHTDVRYLEFAISAPPTQGTLVYRNTSTYPMNSMVLVYTPTNGSSGTDTFTYTADDGLLVSGVATCIVSIVKNEPPEASDMAATAAVGTTRKLWLNTWDPHTPQEALRVDVVSPPTNGMVCYQYPEQYPSNSIQMLYTPTNGLANDRFTYNASDGCDTSATAVCAITVQCNTPPNAGYSLYTMTTNTLRKDITLNAWDNHTDGTLLECTLESQPVNGDVTYQYPGEYPTNSRCVTFALTNIVTGTNEFTYRVSDGDLTSTLATCRVVIVEDTAPTANSASYTLTENQYKDMYLGASDAETASTDLECIIVTPPSHGIVTYSYPESYPMNSRQMRYTPFSGYYGTDSFRFKASDGLLESSAATVTLTIEENTSPTANDMTLTTVECLAKPVTLDVADDESNAYYLECIIVDPPDHGSLVYRYPTSYPVSSRYMTYTADAGYDGPDSFTFVASDGELVSSVATCSITVEVNTRPVTTDMAAETVRDTPIDLTLDVLDGHTSARDLACIIDQPSHGTVVYRYPSSYPANSYYITYTPSTGYVGPDSFSFRASDGSLTSTPAICSMDVTTNNAPEAKDLRATTEPNTAVAISAKYDDPDSGQSITAAVVSNAVHGDVTLNGTTFTYTPSNGYSGIDTFTYKVNDGLDDSNIARALIQVRDASDRAGNLVVLVVNDFLLPVISNEVHRLKTDLENEGYTSKVTPWTLSGSSAHDLWDYLQLEYVNTNQFLQGAILIGNVPKARTYSYHPYYGDTRWFYTDLVYWNMEWFQQADPIATYNIWVTRINADDTNWGSQEVLIKRALDANHNYRTGKSRLPHTAFVFDCFTETPQSTTMLDVWPEVRVGGGGNHNAKYKFMPERTDIPYAACDSFAAGGEVFNETSHGTATGYMEGSWFSESALYRTIAQVRHGLIGSCTSGKFGGIVNNHIFTRGGGLVFAVGGTDINYSGDFQINKSYGNQVGCRARLAAGDSWGGAVLDSYPWENYYSGNRIVFYGDLSIGAMASTSNAMPAITSLVVSKSNPIVDEPVSFTISVTDPDAASSDSPYVNYDHQVEWFMSGYNAGRNNPTYKTNDTQSATWTNVIHSFPAAGTYTIRAEVTDEWQARVWKERTITVTSDPPVAVDDADETLEDTPVVIAVLANDTDPNGDAITVQAVSDPPCGTATHDGTNVTYTPDAHFYGTDYFTYTVRDEWGTTDSAAVSVVVLSQLDNPIAVDDSAQTFPDTPVVLNVLANDGDPDGVGISLLSTTQGSDGSVTHNAGNATYLPNSGFEGTDTFTYTLIDGRGQTASATVTIYISQARPALELAADADTYVRSGDFANDNFGNSQELAVKYTGSSVGNYTRQAYIRFDLSSVHGLVTGSVFRAYCSPWSDSDTHRISLAASDDWLENTMTWNTRIGISDTVLGTWASGPAGFRELDITAAVQEAMSSDKKLTLALTQTTQNNGASYTSRENTTTNRRPCLILSAMQENAPPVAADDVAWTPANNAVAIDALANDVEPNDNGLVVMAVTQGTHGTVVNEGYRIRYTPPPAFEGTNVFDYVVSDGLLCDTATVTVTVGPVQPHLALHWAMNESNGDTLTDTSGYGHTGILVGGPQRIVGPWGGALAFDGIGAYAEAPDSPALDVESLTAACRVHVRSLASVSGAFVNKDQAYAMGIDSDGSLICGLATAGGWQWTDSGVPVPVNRWAHLAVTYDGSVIAYYVEGQLRATLTPSDTGAIQASAGPLRIAASGSGALETPIAVSLDDVRIYSEALGTTEIMGLANPSDNEGDGMPDDEDFDDDNDGMCDADEAFAGTDPWDAASRLQFESSEHDILTGGRVLRWQSTVGKYYSVIGATNLIAGFDTFVATNLPGTPPQNCYTDTVKRGHSVFYRIVLEDE
jgi:hypothetical protein